MSRKMGASLKSGESGVKPGDAMEIVQKNQYERPPTPLISTAP